MKRIILGVVFSSYFFIMGISAYGQQWRQEVKLTLSATLNTSEHTLDGLEQIVYTNHSPDTLRFLWFHIWPNAYKNDKTAYSEYLLANDRTDFYFSNKEQKGYINRLDFTVNGDPAKTEDHPEHIDILKLLLPKPLPPGKQALIATPFHVQVPYNFSGNGRTRNRYELVQWYPVPALYDALGWHPEPLTFQQYQDGLTGDYEVTLQLPSGYRIVAPGAALIDSSADGGYDKWTFSAKEIAGFQWSAAKRDSLARTSVSKGKTIKKKPSAPIKRPLQSGSGIHLFSRLFDTTKVKPVSVLPAIGYNLYDGIMIGAVFHNYLSAAQRFRIVASPLYGTRSGKLNGIARASYRWKLPESPFHAIEAGISLSRFSLNESLDDLPTKEYPGFLKLAPFVKLVFKEKTDPSRVYRYLQLTQFYLKEQSLEYKDVVTGQDTVLGVGLASSTTHITQLKFGIRNTRKLYPYSGELNIERHKEFIRAGITGHYYFNYANNKDGLQVRGFAGKLFYGSRSDLKSFFTRRNHLNLTGPNGEEDYTYSNYFIGRNEFEGFSSQQIMIRDGGFKVRTDLLSDKVGKTDNWLAALNFTSGVPDNINPLSVLPFRIPLKIFADLGTYAEAWDRDANTERFLFDAGLQLSLLHETVNIYLPLVYSRVFRDYNKSYLGEKRFWKTISFSIDLQQLTSTKYGKKLLFP